MTYRKKILVVAAHPDDEILGCGGTMARHSDESDEVHVIFMSDGVASRDTKKGLLNEINKRKQSALDACKIIGAQQPIFLDFPDNQMDTCSMLEITQKLESVINEIKPEVVYTHHNKDLNVDHQLTHQAVMTACRPQPGSYVKNIYSFEVVSSTNWGSSLQGCDIFTPNYYVNIASTIDKKISALSEYSVEMRQFPHSRSIESIVALSKYRGCSVGMHTAEAFQAERQLVF